MHDLIKIAVDAMGGDGSPKKIIDGIIHNHKKNKENFFRIFGKWAMVAHPLRCSPRRPTLLKFLNDSKDF